MVERLKNIITFPSKVLITGVSGSGKTLLGINLLLSLAKTGKKCLIISYLQKELFIDGVKNFCPEISEFLGKNIFFGHIGPKNEDDFLEDIEYALSNLRPEVILVDPLYPDIGEGVFHDICKLLENRNISGIFCYPEAKYLYHLVDYVIELSMERIGGKIKRELTLKSRSGNAERTYSFRIENGEVILEELMPK